MRSKIIALLLASAGLTVTAAACRMGEEGNQAEVKAEARSGLNLAAMDKSVKPGDDFFMYANGTWFRNSEIPADRGSISSSLVTSQELEKRMDGHMVEIATSAAAAG